MTLSVSICRCQAKIREALLELDDLDCNRPQKLGAIQEATRQEGARGRVEALGKMKHCEGDFKSIYGSIYGYVYRCVL